MAIKTKDLKQSVLLSATPEDVYAAFMDSKTHSVFTGAKAKIDPVVGGRFSVWDNYAAGETLELAPGKKIVQSWRASDWPQHHYSTITLLFSKSGKGTKLSFSQKGIPQEFFDDIKQGWVDYYWDPMKEMFATIKGAYGNAPFGVAD